MNRLVENPTPDARFAAAGRTNYKADFPFHTLDGELYRTFPIATVLGIEKALYTRGPVAAEIAATVLYLDNHTATILRVRP